MSADRFVGATLTAHHLRSNRNAIFTGGIRPHYYCLPVLKRETHRVALLKAATSGNPRFFLGTDSAPHPAHLKEHATGCAGCYTAHAALEMYAEAFDSVGKLDQLEAATAVRDLAALPGNRLESLKGDRTGQYSIRINDQWRICFEWPSESRGPRNVEIVDYH
jgi:dihydroorotase